VALIRCRRRRQHHEHLRSRTPLGDRPPPRLGATKAQIRTQFLAESILLAVIGGVVGVLAGAAATAVYASSKNWAVVIPAEAWSGGIASAILIGALAGLNSASWRRSGHSLSLCTSAI
jgi:predicted lysophospholipase L1 biosynthesis ABC-type transport system permease subunit